MVLRELVVSKFITCLNNKVLIPCKSSLTYLLARLTAELYLGSKNNRQASKK